VEPAGSTAEDGGEPVRSCQLDDLLDVPGSREVLHRVQVVTLLLVPPCCRVLQLALGTGILATQLREQEGAQQVVVAVRRTTATHAPGERVALLEPSSTSAASMRSLNRCASPMLRSAQTLVRSMNRGSRRGGRP
jgi:hypothetical protein